MAVARRKTTEEQMVVRPDSKGRITLGALAKGISSYAVSKDEDGKLTLVPYKEIPAREVWLFNNPEALEKVRRGLDDIAEGRIVSRGDFTQYAEDDD